MVEGQTDGLSLVPRMPEVSKLISRNNCQSIISDPTRP